MAAPTADLVITREFDAPRELVFRCWTEPEHFAQWYGPQGFTIPHCTMDVRVGGTKHFCMRGPKMGDAWFAGEFLEIAPPERIVMTEFIADRDGNPVPPATYGFNEDWPGKTVITVTLEDLGGRTRMTMRQADLPVGPARDGAGWGWNQSFDKIPAVLEALGVG